MRILTSIVAISLLIGNILVSCKKGQESSAPSGPIAHVGLSSITVVLPSSSTILQGTAYSDAGIASYLWTKVDGPSQLTLVNPTSWSTEVKDLVEGTYVFEFKVTDSRGLSDLAKVTVNVTLTAPPPSPWDY